MIPFLIDVSQVRASSLSSRLEGACDSVTSKVEMHAPERVVASNADPVAEWTDLGSESGASVSTLKLPLPDLAWTPVHEKRFLDLAGREATGELTPQDSADLERLSHMRRGLKNPRRGEELLWEVRTAPIDTRPHFRFEPICHVPQPPELFVTRRVVNSRPPPTERPYPTC